MNILQKANSKILFSLFFLIVTLLPVQASAATYKMIVITEMGMIPETLSLNQGDDVQLMIHNKNGKVHKFMIPKLNVQSPYLMEGEMAMVTFKATEPGTFFYHVNSPQFGQAGFTGTLTVKKAG